MRRGSRVDVCVRSPGQVRKEAAQVDCVGSLGSFYSLSNYAPQEFGPLNSAIWIAWFIGALLIFDRV